MDWPIRTAGHSLLRRYGMGRSKCCPKSMGVLFTQLQSLSSASILTKDLPCFWKFTSSTHIYIYTHIHIYTYIYVYTHTCTHTHTYIYIHTFFLITCLFEIGKKSCGLLVVNCCCYVASFRWKPKASSMWPSTYVNPVSLQYWKCIKQNVAV